MAASETSLGRLGAIQVRAAKITAMPNRFSGRNAIKHLGHV